MESFDLPVAALDGILGALGRLSPSLAVVLYFDPLALQGGGEMGDSGLELRALHLQPSDRRRQLGDPPSAVLGVALPALTVLLQLGALAFQTVDGCRQSGALAFQTVDGCRQLGNPA